MSILVKTDFAVSKTWLYCNTSHQQWSHKCALSACLLSLFGQVVPLTTRRTTAFLRVDLAMLRVAESRRRIVQVGEGTNRALNTFSTVVLKKKSHMYGSANTRGLNLFGEAWCDRRFRQRHTGPRQPTGLPRLK